MARIGIDREPEEHKLEQRNAEHHRKREAIAAHLREFLHHDPDQPHE